MVAPLESILNFAKCSMTLRYAHLAPSHKVKALDVLNETLGGPSTSYLLDTNGVGNEDL
jgi:hypothetical protein